MVLKLDKTNKVPMEVEMQRCNNNSKYYSISSNSNSNNNSCNIYNNIKCNSNNFISNRYLSNTVTSKAETPVFRQLSKISVEKFFLKYHIQFKKKKCAAAKIVYLQKATFAVAVIIRSYILNHQSLRSVSL